MASKKLISCTYFLNLTAKRFSFQLVFFILLGSSTVSSATELTLYAGYRSGEEFKDEISNQTINLDEGSSVGIILNVPYSKVTEMEFLYSSQSTKLSESGLSVDGLDIDIDYWHLGGTYLFPREKYVPYFVATLGATHMKPDGLSSETKFSFSLGGGAKIPLGTRLGLRLEGRAFMTTLDSGGALFCSNGQCNIAASSSLFAQLEASVGLTLKF
jgi:hypothetical protein